MIHKYWSKKLHDFHFACRAPNLISYYLALLLSWFLSPHGCLQYNKDDKFKNGSIHFLILIGPHILVERGRGQLDRFKGIFILSSSTVLKFYNKLEHLKKHVKFLKITFCIVPNLCKSSTQWLTVLKKSQRSPTFYYSNSLSNHIC